MIVSGNVPEHLVVAAQTGFLASLPEVPVNASRPFVRVLPMGAKSVDLVDLGAAPMPTENKGRTQVQSFIEKKLVVTPKNWDITVGLSYNASMDDQTGDLETKVKAAGENFPKHMDNLAFDALKNGAATTSYGAGYDSLAFFSASHVDSGADYQTVQSNSKSLAFSLANFKTVRALGRAFLDDRGQPLDIVHNTIVAHPDYEYDIEQLIRNQETAGTGNRDLNPYAGKMNAIYSAQITSGQYFLLNTSQTAKPIILALRESPNLQSAWFDPNGPDGGMYYFKFYARYNIFYGDWRLAIKGN
jgi:phage major head subunit gpT-like protein